MSTVMVCVTILCFVVPCFVFACCGWRHLGRVVTSEIIDSPDPRKDDTTIVRTTEGTFRICGRLYFNPGDKVWVTDGSDGKVWAHDRLDARKHLVIGA